MPDENPRLVVGLGNPGRQYRSTRHNVGFMIADEIAAHYGFGPPRDLQATVCRSGAVGGVRALVVKPQAYMNRSGPPVRAVAEHYGIPYGSILVVYDDIDLVFGRLKIKEKGGFGGHNGLRSLIESFGGGDFPRLRIGVGRPDDGSDIVDWVLQPFRPQESELLDRILARAREAVATLLVHGAREAMNRFNDRGQLVLR